MRVDGRDHEELAERLVEGVAVGRRSALSTIEHLVRNNQETEVDTFVLASCIAASALEDWYSGDEAVARAAIDLWRLAGTLACDGMLLRSAGLSRPSARDLIHLWQASGTRLF